MKVTQTGNVTWMIDFGEYWQFIEYMWRSMLENDAFALEPQHHATLLREHQLVAVQNKGINHHSLTEAYQ